MEDILFLSLKLSAPCYKANCLKCNTIFFSLQASDPSTYELIQKIHALQKRLISKTEEVVEKELLLQVQLVFLMSVFRVPCSHLYPLV